MNSGRKVVCICQIFDERWYLPRVKPRVKSRNWLERRRFVYKFFFVFICYERRRFTRVNRKSIVSPATSSSSFSSFHETATFHQQLNCATTTQLQIILLQPLHHYHLPSPGVWPIFPEKMAGILFFFGLHDATHFLFFLPKGWSVSIITIVSKESWEIYFKRILLLHRVWSSIFSYSLNIQLN